MHLEIDGGMDLETAARALGVHYQTAYRWVRDGVLPAVKIGVGYRLTSTDVDALAQRRGAHQPLSYTGRRRDWDRLRGQLHDALVEGDETAARRLFERIRLARVPVLDQCEQLVAPVIHRIGDEWTGGKVSAATVRLAAGIAGRCLVWAQSGLPARRRRLLVLMITPAGDAHRLPALMATAALREAAWDVRPVSDVDLGGIVALAHQLRPALAVVSVAAPWGCEAAPALQARLQTEANIPVLIGEPGQPVGALVEDAAAIGARLPGRRRDRETG